MVPTKETLQVRSLGQPSFPSPLHLPSEQGFVDHDRRVVLDFRGQSGEELYFESAGPRKLLYFDPSRVTAAVVTCGGLCPGLNNVIRALVHELIHRYQVPRVLGFRFGYEGLVDPSIPPLTLGPDQVRHIHNHGGSVLGLGRGKQDIAAMVDGLVKHDVKMLFTLGGDGTQRGAHAIVEEIARRNLNIAVVGVPKTIDNDVAFVDRTFGFETAVEVARQALDAAHTEAFCARHGVGLVKLMGRDSGFLAAHATLASDEVNFCLVPEVPFKLDGPGGLLDSLEQRLRQRGHALIVVAEGCGAALASEHAERDASGNIRYASRDADIGLRIKEAIEQHFKHRQLPLTLKYIDPSYMVRGVPANASDAVFCDVMARNAVHAAMAGRTDLIVGRWHGVFTHVPLELATSERRKINPHGDLWGAVVASTGQPALM